MPGDRSRVNDDLGQKIDLLFIDVILCRGMNRAKTAGRAPCLDAPRRDSPDAAR